MTEQNQPRTTSGRGRLFDSILETVGDTPVIRVNNLAPAHATIYVKGEFFNPAASVKDRLALAIIERGERTGALKPGMTVVEATSGNTGIGLAMVCAQKGYPLVVTMADSFSIERRKLMRMLGAKVVLTPAAEKGSGMLAKAVELANTHGWFLCRQFENQANADVHSRTTAREIINDFADQRLVVAEAIEGGGVQVRIAGVERAFQHPFGLVARRRRPVGVGEAHAAEADGRDVEGTDGTGLHGGSGRSSKTPRRAPLAGRRQAPRDA